MVLVYFLFTALMKALSLGDVAVVTARLAFIPRDLRPYVALCLLLAEAAIIMLLLFSRTKVAGVCISTVLLIVFSIYVVFNLNTHCGCTGKPLTSWSDTGVNIGRIVVNIALAFMLLLWVVPRVRFMWHRKEKTNERPPGTTSLPGVHTN